MPNRAYLRRTVLGAVAGAALLVAAAVLGMTESPVLRLVGAVIAVGLVVGWLGMAFFEARAWERHAERFPELLRNEAIGKSVTALGGFARVDGEAIGTVELNGERWKARCVGDVLPVRGQLLVVRSREGLMLEVEPQRGSP